MSAPRPASRQGATGARPVTGASGMRPPSARTGTAAPARPMSGYRAPTGYQAAGPPPATGLRRQLTQQGVAGVKTAAGPGRQVMDVSYYSQLLRGKINELNEEIDRMTAEVAQFEKENAEAIRLERKAQETQGSIVELRKQLAVYNILVEKSRLNSEVTPAMLSAETKTKKLKNDQESKKVDQVFTDRQHQDEMIRQAEIKVAQVQQRIEQQLSELPEAQRQTYNKLTDENSYLHNDMADYQEQLDRLTGESLRIEEEIKQDPARVKLMQAYNELHQLEQKRAELAEMTNQQLSLPEERERLLQKMKLHNEEIAQMDQETKVAREQVEEYRDKIESMREDFKQLSDDKLRKYRELVSRDKGMTQFIDNYETTRAEISQENTKTEMKIAALIEHISRNMDRQKNMPSKAQQATMRSDLAFKEQQMKQSQTTQASLQAELASRKKELEKMQTLDGKILSDTEALKNKMNTMRAKTIEYGDLDALKSARDTEKKEIMAEKAMLRERKLNTSRKADALQRDLDEKVKKLEQSDVHSQLVVLEKSFSTHLQNNFVIKEHIAVKSAESDYKAIHRTVMLLLDELNGINVARAMPS